METGPNIAKVCNRFTSILRVTIPGLPSMYVQCTYMGISLSWKSGLLLLQHDSPVGCLLASWQQLDESEIRIPESELIIVGR